MHIVLFFPLSSSFEVSTKVKVRNKILALPAFMKCVATNYLLFANLSSLSSAAKSLQSCPTLCDPIDSSPPGSPVPGILQTRTLEWAAISFSSA